MAELKPIRAFSIGKARNLFRNAGIALKDAHAPKEHVSAPRRFDAAYDCGLSCALLLLEASKQELVGQGHHMEAMAYLVKTLQLRGQNADTATVMVRFRNLIRYDAEPVIDEAAVVTAIAWAERVLAETESWLSIHQPNVLKAK